MPRPLTNDSGHPSGPIFEARASISTAPGVPHCEETANWPRKRSLRHLVVLGQAIDVVREVPCRPMTRHPDNPDPGRRESRAERFHARLVGRARVDPSLCSVSPRQSSTPQRSGRSLPRGHSWSAWPSDPAGWENSPAVAGLTGGRWARRLRRNWFSTTAESSRMPRTAS